MRYTTVFALLAIVSVCSAQFMTIGQILQSDPGFSTLYSLIEATGLAYVLEGTAVYTLFAPNNTAFDAVPAATLKYLTDPANKNILTSVITYHLVGGALVSSSLAGYENRSLVTVQGSAIDLTVTSPFKNNLPFTINLNSARVVKPNIQASNGVVHVIDTLLLNDIWMLQPPADNIMDVIRSRPELSTLLAVLELSQLDKFLENTNEGPFTILAPVDSAFSDPILAGLTSTSNADVLKQVLLYHVITAPAYSVNLSDGLQVSPYNANSANVGPVTFRRLSFPGASSVTVNGANILTTDLTAANGVVHTIDRVLLPYAPF